MEQTTANDRTRGATFKLSRDAAGFLREYAVPLGVFAALRVWTLVWASAVARFAGVSAEATKHYYGVAPLRDAVIAPWQRWDTLWFAKLAIEGYAADPRVVFPPLYPLLMRLTAPFVSDNYVGAGLLLSTIAALACFMLLYRLARDEFGASSARRAVFWLGAFPTAFYLFAAYTEALFLALILGAFLCAGRRRWLGAGLLAGLAAMTRAQGIFLILPFAVEFWLQFRERRVPLARGWTLGLILLGSAAHLGWLTWQFGTPAVWLDAQDLWHQAVMPWQAVAAMADAILDASGWVEQSVSIVLAGMALLLVTTVIWSARRLALSYTLYAAILALPPFFVVTTYSEQYPLIGVGRSVLIAFPLFLLLGSMGAKRWQPLVLGASFLLQAVWMMLFVAWVFVH